MKIVKPASKASTKSTPVPPTQSTQGAKKRSSLALLIIGLIVAVGVIIGLIFWLLSLVGDSRSGGGGANFEGAPTVALEKSVFIDNRYASGARTLKVDGDAKVLGLSSDGERLAVWREMAEDRPSDLSIYDTSSLKRVAGVEARDCTSWHSDDVVLCVATDEDGVLALRPYGMDDASLVSEDSIYSHPFTNDAADVTTISSPDYLGSFDETALFTLKATNSYFDPSGMSEQESARATTVLGLTSASSRMLVALHSDNSELWSTEITDNDFCGPVAKTEAIVCLDLTSNMVDSETIIKVLDSKTGEIKHEQTTRHQVVVASDGFVEVDNSPVEVDQNTPLEDLLKGAPISVYDFDGELKEQTHLDIEVVPGFNVPDSQWLPEHMVAYPVSHLTDSQASLGIFAANGEVVAQTKITQSGVAEITSAHTGERVTAGTAKFVSTNGEVLLVAHDELGPSANLPDSGDFLALSQVGSATLYNLVTGEEIIELTEGGLASAEVQGGLIVAQATSAGGEGRLLSVQTYIYLPGK